MVIAIYVAEIKGALTFVSHIQAMLDSQETMDEMKKILG